MKENNVNRWWLKRDMKFHVPLFFVLILFTNETFAQTEDSVKYGRPVSHQIIIASAAVSTITAVLVTQDANIQHFFYSNSNKFIEKSSEYFFSPLGNGIISIPVLCGFFIKGEIDDDQRAKNTAIAGIEAYLIAGIATGVIKQAVHRHRPFQDEIPNPLHWDGPFSKISYNSFPSGHSSSIFAVATVIATQYHDVKWVPPVCYTVAGITSVYRLAVNKHWASDVFFGAALGFAAGKAAIKFNSTHKFRIFPFSDTGTGITMVWFPD